MEELVLMISKLNSNQVRQVQRKIIVTYTKNS